MAGEPQLECTERALISRVCELDGVPLRQELEGAQPYVRFVRYEAPVAYLGAVFVYQTTTPAKTVQLLCSIPAGGHTKIGRVTLDDREWRAIAATGGEVPTSLRPENLLVPVHRASPSTSVPVTTDPADQAVGEACTRRAVDVFSRLARGEITMAEARRQLPANVPPSALQSGLEGVKRYQRSDGFSREDAINEAAGAVGQACQN